MLLQLKYKGHEFSAGIDEHGFILYSGSAHASPNVVSTIMKKSVNARIEKDNGWLNFLYVPTGEILVELKRRAIDASIKYGTNTLFCGSGTTASEEIATCNPIEFSAYTIQDMLASGCLVPGRDNVSVRYKDNEMKGNLTSEGCFEFEGKIIPFGARLIPLRASAKLNPNVKNDNGWGSVDTMACH